jgi:hypothetical protein
MLPYRIAMIVKVVSVFNCSHVSMAGGCEDYIILAPSQSRVR